MRGALLVIALLVTAFSVVALAPAAEARELFCTGLTSTHCSGSLLCVDNLDSTDYVACVHGPCDTTQCW